MGPAFSVADAVADPWLFIRALLDLALALREHRIV